MKIKAITSPNRYTKSYNTSITKTNAFVRNNSYNILSDYPKSYIKFNQSFRGSLEDEINKENEANRNKRKDDYLWARNWDNDKAWAEYWKQAEAEIKIESKKSIWGINKEDKEAIIDKYKKLYFADLAKYKEIMDREDEYKKLLKEDQAIQHKTKSELLKSSNKSIDSKIAGYSNLKRIMRYEFVNPVKDELFDGQERKVANCITLCGPTGCGKTVLAEAMANETSCFVDTVTTDTAVDRFPEIISDKIDEARERYDERLAKITELKNSVEYSKMTDDEKKEALLKIGSPRTVIIIDEFDKYFNPIITDEGTRIANRNCLKGAFDGCAELPKPGNGKAVGVTFLCTTNYPSRIDADLAVGKCDKYAVVPPSSFDMIDVIQHYMNKANILINDFMEEIPNLHEIDVKKINLKKFVENFAPSPEKGAFSNDAIQYLVLDAADDYIARPDIDFRMHLIRKFKNAPRDITPQKYEKYMQELEGFRNLNNDPLDNKDRMTRREFLEAEIAEYDDILDVLTEDDLAKYNELKKELEELNKNEGEN